MSAGSRISAALVVLAGFLAPRAAQAADAPLRVVSAGPTGEIDEWNQASEVRIAFSEPMVAAGAGGAPVRLAWFRIHPETAGELRWSDTRNLVFRPATKLPDATKFTVTLSTGAKAASGAALPKAYRFSFTTPTLRLTSLRFFRKSVDEPLLVAVETNQPFDLGLIGAVLDVRLAPRPFTAPVLSRGGAARLGDDEKAQWAARKSAAAAAAAKDAPIGWEVPASWDRRVFPPSPRRLVLRTTTAPPAGTRISVGLPAGARSTAGPEGTSAPQVVHADLPEVLFPAPFVCQKACDPDSANALRFTVPVRLADLRAAASVRDLTGGAEIAVPLAEAGPGAKVHGPYGEEMDGEEPADAFSLEDLGFTPQPAHTYAVRLAPTLRSADGQTLGTAWADVVELWHRSAFTSFGTGHGVWEKGSGRLLPYSARNLRSVREWTLPVSAGELVATIGRLENGGFSALPGTPGRERDLAPKPDVVGAHGLDLSSALSPNGFGVVWAGLRNGPTIEKSKRAGNGSTAGLVQVTNLAIHSKDSPTGTLVFVTRLDDGRPVAGAAVTLRRKDGGIAATATTADDGVAKLPVGLRDRESPWQMSFVVTAEKDGDLAYLVNDWTEGITPWEFGFGSDLDEALPLLRGIVFTDRGVYKRGEEVHLKAILRSDTPGGIGLLPAGTKVKITVTDPRDRKADERTVELSDMGSADWTMRIGANATLGRWSIAAESAGQRLTLSSDFLVAAYRRPEFRVDARLSVASPVAGEPLRGMVTASYLYGAPMGGRDVRWSWVRTRGSEVAAAIGNRFPSNRWVFRSELGEEEHTDDETIAADSANLSAAGGFSVDLPTRKDAGRPLRYRLEGEVTDVTRQKLAGRAVVQVEPAPFAVGFSRPPYLAKAEKGLPLELVAAAFDGTPRAGIPLLVTLTRVEWTSVRRAEGDGFATWESEEKRIPAGEWKRTSGSEPFALEFPLPSGGFYELVVRGADPSDAERSATASTSFYAVGAGYTAWERYDHNRIDLIPEKKSWAPGETARILVKSPWERATALLTVEREGVRSHRVFELRGTQPTLEVPVTERDVPNVYVSLLLVRGRTANEVDAAGNDPGKPAFRMGSVELRVPPVGKHLEVAVASDREEYRPGAVAKVDVSVERDGKPAKAEVTLWAVDSGVLSLTDYRPPDVVSSVWLEKGQLVWSADSRQRIVSRRVLTPKGDSEGGGGGRDSGPGSIRKDFRVLAFWLGALVTDGSGRAHAEVKLPESMTAYRIMAVAADRDSRFGRGEREIRVNKPVLLQPAFPRFLTLGDRASFGSVVRSGLAKGGTATVTMESLDPSVVALDGPISKKVEVPANGSVEVRWNAVAGGVGSARFRTSVSLAGETDAYEDALPVEVIATPETYAAHGLADPKAAEKLAVPKDALPGYGGLELQLSSTALVGLSEGARYLVEYPYGCAEQRSSRTLALLEAYLLGEPFRIPELSGAKLRAAIVDAVADLDRFRCEDGSFAFWAGSCPGRSPYLSAWVLHVLVRARELGFAPPADAIPEAARHLAGKLDEIAAEKKDLGPLPIAWQAFATKVIAEAKVEGFDAAPHLERLAARTRPTPVFALAYLLDASVALGRKESGPAARLRERIRNAILPEGGSAHVEELRDDSLAWCWSSNERSTAIALSSLVRASLAPADDRPTAIGMVTWLLAVRKNGRWGSTQENAAALAGLGDYYRAYEAGSVPDFTATAAIGRTGIAKEKFAGRSAAAKAVSLAMPELLRALAGGDGPLSIEKAGSGTLHYSAHVTFAYGGADLPALDRGFTVSRKYEVVAGEEEAIPHPAARTGTGSLELPAGSLVRVTLTLRLPKERRFVAVTDPLPAGLEPVDSAFATTAAALSAAQESEESRGDWGMDGGAFSGGFDHVERADDRVELFATRLSAGEHVFSYLARATTSGTFHAAPARALEMYEEEVFGRSAGDVVLVPSE